MRFFHFVLLFLLKSCPDDTFLAHFSLSGWIISLVKPGTDGRKWDGRGEEGRTMRLFANNVKHWTKAR